MKNGEIKGTMLKKSQYVNLWHDITQLIKKKLIRYYD